MKIGKGECPRCSERRVLYDSTGNCKKCRDDEIYKFLEGMDDAQNVHDGDTFLELAKGVAYIFNVIRKDKEPAYDGEDYGV